MGCLVEIAIPIYCEESWDNPGVCSNDRIAAMGMKYSIWNVAASQLHKAHSRIQVGVAPQFPQQ